MTNTYIISVSDIAEQSIEEAYLFYLDKNEKLAIRFLSCLDKKLKSLSTFPVRTRAQANYHYYPLNDFPYAIVYTIDSTDCIVFITDVIHTSKEHSYF
jgi:plasmid stabilization system protein ParE